MPEKFRTLEVAIEYARVCSKLRLARHLKDQLDRSSSSIALNLAEGSAKGTRGDRYRYYRIALGSFRETEVILRIAQCDHGPLEILRSKLAGSLVNLVMSESRT